MPVKKQKPTARKKTAPKKKIEKEIKEAVEKIPEFLFTKVEAPPISKEKPKFSQANITNYREYQKRRLLLWLSITLFTAAILGLWFWNISTLWQDAKMADSPEKNLWQEAKTEIDNLKTPNAELSDNLQEQEKIKQELKNQIEQELTKAKIKDAINLSLNEYIATTTVTNTTKTP